MRLSEFTRIATWCLGFSVLTPIVFAQFTVFEGGTTAESQWRAAAAALNGGNTPPLEDFESYTGVPSPFSGPSDQIIALASVQVVFTSDIPGAYPGVYSNASQAHSGVNQLANFGGGLPNAADYGIHPAPGREIVALAFWQCDPQGDQPMTAFAADGTQLGTIVGRINNGSGSSFAGFISTTPVASIHVEGMLGDGWNHIDDLQVVTQAPCGVDCPGDVNCDGVVDLSDLTLLLSNFGAMAGATRGMGDLDLDGDVELGDLTLLLSAFGSICE